MLLAIALLVAGVAVGFFGLKMFRILLPIVGLVTGVMAGFSGFQGVFGTGKVSTTMAVFTGIAVGLVLAVLSYVFFEIALTIQVALLGSAALSFLGIALGLGNNGFVLLMLSIAGFVMGLSLSAQSGFSTRFVVIVTSLIGVAYVLASILLIVGDLTVDSLFTTGIVNSIIQVVDNSFLWLFVWLGGALIAQQFQYLTLMQEFPMDQFAYTQPTTKARK